MSMPIHGVARYASVASSTGPLRPSAALKQAGIKESAAPSFESRVLAGVDRVDAVQQKADTALAELASGENVDLHGTMIALQKADISLRTMVTVRDKFISAYEQVMNMAI